MTESELMSRVRSVASSVLDVDVAGLGDKPIRDVASDSNR